MKFKKYILLIFTILVIAITFFMYGFIAGKDRIFPHDQLRDIRDYVSDYILGTQYRHVRVVMSGLHRLLLKEIEIEEDYSKYLYVRGGAIGSLDNLLYIYTNRNDEKKEYLVVFDMENIHRMGTGGLAAPMNYHQLMNSSIVELEGFEIERFRVNGIHLEQSGESVHTLFISHHLFHPEENCISYNVSRTTIEIGQFSLSQITDWETIFTADPCLYPEIDKMGLRPFSGEVSGGSVVEYDKEHLLVSVGSFHRDGVNYESLAMDPSTTFGKIILLNKNTGDFEIYAKGIRNSQGLLIDSKGRIWALDHGPRGGDELNLIRKGSNYGWPEVTYGIDYGRNPWPNNEIQGSHDKYEQPVFAWLDAIAPSNLIQIPGEKKFPLWKGDLVISTLKNNSLHRLRIEGDVRVVYDEVVDIGHRIRGLTTIKDGKIALLTDSGLLIIIDDGGPHYEPIDSEIETRIADLRRYEQLRGEVVVHDVDPGMRTADNIFMQKCASCHQLQENIEIGPHLHQIFSRKTGELEGFNFSQSLAENNEYWTPELMRSFLLRPSQRFPGTTMQQVPLTETEADSIIHFLVSRE